MVKGAGVQFRGPVLDTKRLLALALHRNENLLPAAGTARRRRGRHCVDVTADEWGLPFVFDAFAALFASCVFPRGHIQETNHG